MSSARQPDTEPRPAGRQYRADIDGLRAVAILGVVLYHSGLPGLGGGFTGVDIFFVISGFLIGGHILSEIAAGSFGWAEFYRLRAKRILPALFTVILLTLVAGLGLLSPFELARLARAAAASAVSVPNFLFWHSIRYFESKSDWMPLLMTWSLGVEEQFYLLIPALLVVLGRFKRNWTLPVVLLGCAASFAVAEWQLGGESQRAMQAAFYLLPARAWELGAGVALAAFFASPPLKNWKAKKPLTEVAALAGLACVLAPFVLLRPFTPFPGAAALPSVVGTALLLATEASWINRRLLGFRPLVFVGRVSYSWYLFHWPVFSFLRIAVAGELARPVALGAIVFSFALAVGCYYLVEQPFRASRRRAGPLLLRYGLATAAVLSMSVALWAGGGLPQRFPELARMEATPSDLNADGCMVDADVNRPSEAAGCRAADDGRPLVALWGDSHASALGPALKELAAAEGLGVTEKLKSACLPLVGAYRYIPAAPALTRPCLEFNQRALDEIRGDGRVRVVVVAGDWKSPLALDAGGGWLAAGAEDLTRRPAREQSQQRLAAALTGELRALRAAGKEVLLVEEAPNFDFSPDMRLRAANIPARRALAAWLGGPAAGDPGSAPLSDRENDALATQALREAAQEANAKTWNPKPRLCSAEGQCRYQQDLQLLYLDGGHLTPAGAREALVGLRLR